VANLHGRRTRRRGRNNEQTQPNRRCRWSSHGYLAVRGHGHTCRRAEVPLSNVVGVQRRRLGRQLDERGLGNENVDYTLTADATALYACLNRGGNHPQAANKEAFEGQVSGGGSFEPKNGRVVASLATGPLLAPQFTCPSGQQRVLAAVSYTNIVLTDTSNGVSTAVPDASRIFFDV
jgi:hypothetical protein